MAKKRGRTAPTPATQWTVEDHRERFVLHGLRDDRPSCVPPGPSIDLDLEEALRRLDDPERRRVRQRRHSML